MSKYSSTYKHLFAPGGDLTEKALLDYAYNRMPEEERVAAEAHIAACEFCRDALEGVLMFASEATYIDALADVKDKVEDKAAPKVHTIHMYRRLAVAASVLLVMGIAFYFVNDQIGQQRDVAMTTAPENKEVERTVPQEVTAPVTLNDSQQMESIDITQQDASGTGGSGYESNTGLSAGTYTVTVTDENQNATREPQKKEGTKHMEVEEITPDTTRQWAEYMSTSNAGSNWDGVKRDEYRSDSVVVVDQVETFRGKKSKQPVVSGSSNGTLENKSEGGAAPYTYKWQGSDDVRDEKMVDKDMADMEQKTQSADMAPVYKGGEEMLKQYLAGAGLPSSLSGKDSVKIELNIDTKGRVEKVNILAGEITKKEADSLKAYLMKMPLWEPALYNGVAVKSKRIVFIRY